MRNTKTVNLKLSLEEFGIIYRAVGDQESALEERISVGRKFPDSEILSASAAEAQAELPGVQALSRQLKGVMDALDLNFDQWACVVMGPDRGTRLLSQCTTKGAG